MTDRREFIAVAAGAVAAAALGDQQFKSAGTMGIVIHSYPLRSRIQKGFNDPLHFLEFCRERGAAGVQLPLGQRDADYAKELRASTEKHGLYVEGSLRCPKDKNDVERFEAEVRTAKACGAAVVRTVMLGGRRYETFKSSQEFQDFKEQALRSLQLAEPIVKREKLRLAVENHKDYRTDELVALMKQIGSEFVGACVDTGNSIALLEDPLETVKALAPFAMSCHLKDMGVEEHADGFLLSEVPLGEGRLPLKSIVETLRKARPELRFSLEMITRDPLRIPCLTENYWQTLRDVRAQELARMLRLAKQLGSQKKLPRISQLKEAEQLQVEDDNVRQSLAFAKKEMGL